LFRIYFKKPWFLKWVWTALMRPLANLAMMSVPTVKLCKAHETAIGRGLAMAIRDAVRKTFRRSSKIIQWIYSLVCLTLLSF